MILLLGFGVPALQLSGVPTRRVFWGDRRARPDLHGVRRRGLPRGHRVGAPEPGRGGPLARALALQTLRHVVLPQAVRRVIPALLNDLVGLQKDSALVCSLGVIDAFHQAQIDVGATFNYTPLAAAGCSCVTIPMARFTDWLSRATAAARRRAGVWHERARRSRAAQVVRRARGPARYRPRRVDAHEVVCLIGASGSGKSTLLRCVNLLEPIDAGRIVARRRGHHAAAASTSNAVRRRIGIVFQAFNLFPHMSVLATSRSRRARCTSSRAPRPRRGRSAARALRPARQAREYPDRLSGGQQQRVAIVRALASDRADAARRGHERARPRARGRGARRDPRPRRGR